MNEWFKQTDTDAHVTLLFYSMAGAETQKLLQLTKPYPSLDVFGYRCIFLIQSLGLSKNPNVRDWRDELLTAYLGKGSIYLRTKQVPEVVKGIFLIATFTGFFCCKCKKIVDDPTEDMHSYECEDLSEPEPKSDLGYGMLANQPGSF